MATEVTFEDPVNDTEQLIATPETRHGVRGWRVLRFEKDNAGDEGDMNWDEKYQFYESLDDIYKAFKSKDYAAAIARF